MSNKLKVLMTFLSETVGHRLPQTMAEALTLGQGKTLYNFLAYILFLLKQARVFHMSRTWMALLQRLKHASLLTIVQKVYNIEV
jgi:hypothetical protein